MPPNRAALVDVVQQPAERLETREVVSGQEVVDVGKSCL
jgi:hypothetical protein